MSSIKKITEAKTTCDGLHRLVRKLNSAAVDLDKSGGSAYELIALLASTHACVSSLSTQLEELAGEDQRRDTTVTPLHPLNELNTARQQPEAEHASEIIEKSLSARG